MLILPTNTPPQKHTKKHTPPAAGVARSPSLLIAHVEDPKSIDVNTAGYATEKSIREYPFHTIALSKGIITGITIDVIGYHPSKNSFEGEPMPLASVAGHKL